MTTAVQDDQAHQRLPDHVRVLPTSHPAYQDALRRMVEVVLADVRDRRDADDRAP